MDTFDIASILVFRTERSYGFVGRDRDRDIDINRHRYRHRHGHTPRHRDTYREIV